MSRSMIYVATLLMLPASGFAQSHAEHQHMPAPAPAPAPAPHEHVHDEHEIMPDMNAHDMTDMSAMEENSATVSFSRDPHAYAESLPASDRFAEQGHHLSLADDHAFWAVLGDRVERYGDSGNYDVDLLGWYGQTFSRMGFTLDAHASNEGLESASGQLFWNRAMSAFFDTQAGVRVDRYVGGENRQWLAAGIQGLAPNWFEVSATAYLGESGRFAFSAESEYDLRLSRRIYLQPRVELDWYSRSDVVNRLGRGLAELSAGLRLRYEFTPRFAPYLGLSWSRSFAETAKLLRENNMADEENRWVIGLRFWL
ncbi:MAG: copper resistance protein B [Pseudohongiella nitratireducens]|nr:copper resistance protein B [Pseudohongiella nitratireducens]MDF1623419.1 copper resistance protein B [Pseudohongiella nitratireducens]